MRAFCFGRIIKDHEGVSIWEMRHGDGPFTGLRLPHGCLIHFMQTPKKFSDQPKASPRLVPGVFLYHHVRPGGKLSGEYCVLPLTQFAGLDMSSSARHHHIKPQRVREVKVLSDEWPFPLREAWAIANETYQGVTRTAGLDDHSTPLGDPVEVVKANAPESVEGSAKPGSSDDGVQVESTEGVDAPAMPLHPPARKKHEGLKMMAFLLTLV